MKEFLKNFARSFVYALLLRFIIDVFPEILRSNDLAIPRIYKPIFLSGIFGFIVLMIIIFTIIIIIRSNLVSLKKIGIIVVILTLLGLFDIFLRNHVTTVQYEEHVSGMLGGPSKEKQELNMKNPTRKNCIGFSQDLILVNHSMIDIPVIEKEFRCYGVYKK